MSSLQDKLYNYEQTPPEKAWDKIAAALDESHIADEFPSKLYNAEAVPPAAAWDKIAGALEPAHTPAIAMSKSFSFFRYAAAALFIGLVAFGIFKWTSGNNNKTNDGIAGVSRNTNNTNNTDLAAKKNTGEVNTQEVNTQKDNEPIENTTDIGNARVKIPSVKKVKNNYAITDNTDEVAPIYAYNEHTPNLADRYIMLMTPDGGIIRMSKKWGDLVCCVSGQEQDENCKDQLKKWQEKIACSPITTSPGNFMDILSLVNSLNDTEL